MYTSASSAYEVKYISESYLLEAFKGAIVEVGVKSRIL
jgi:hypothetical protein